MLDLNEVALAALLLDVGKLLQQVGLDRPSRGELGYSEAVWETALGRGETAEQDQGDVLAPAVVVRGADKLASPSEHAGVYDPAAPLRPVLDVVELEGRGSVERGWGYRPIEYGGEIGAHLPRPPGSVEADPFARRRLVEGLAEGLRRLRDPRDPTSVMNVLERFGSYVRSATGRRDDEDVSLFDRSRVTAAVAVCIAGHLNATGTEPSDGEVEREDAERFLFARGDISGVQSFLYTITSKGALRMLRARSFFLELLAEHAVAEILRRSGVPRTNAIFVAGGGFLLLLPNTSESEEALRRVGEEINSTLAEEFGHGLYLALAAVPCAADGIGRRLPETLAEAGKRLSESKAGKFRGQLDWLLAESREPEPESCDVCARDDAPVERYQPRNYMPWQLEDDGVQPLSLCTTCLMLARASLRLPQSHHLRAGGEGFSVGETAYGLSSSRHKPLYALDGLRDEEASLSGAVPLPVARYADRDDEGQILEFGELANKAAGVARLAVLRMDVDDLGEIFRSGLPPSLRTFGRYAALSRSLSTFFKTVVPQICEGAYEGDLRLFGAERRRAVTVVYSGGDDLFLVGAWSDVMELAVSIRRAFREFACHNPSVTLSAGISLHSPGEPLYLMAEQAGAAEGIAKENSMNGEKKDSAVLFYRGADTRRISYGVPEALFWRDIEDGVVPLVEKVESFRGDDGRLPFPRGFTRLLIDVVDVYEQEGHLSLPRLAYALARMEETGKLKDDERWRELKRDLLNIETVKKYVRPAAYWLDLAERRREEADGTR